MSEAYPFVAKGGIERAIWSDAPPALKGTTSSTGLVGSHAKALSAQHMVLRKRPTFIGWRIKFFCMMLSPVIGLKPLFDDLLRDDLLHQ